MAVKLQRPILVGGVALAFGLWGLETVHDSLVSFSETAVTAAIAAGAGIWLFARRQRNPLVLEDAIAPLPDRAAVEADLAVTETALEQLQAERDLLNQPSDTATQQHNGFHQQLSQLRSSLDRKALNIALLGKSGTGKTTLLQHLQANWVPTIQCPLMLQDSTALLHYASEQAEKDLDAPVLNQAREADLVLFLTTEDLTEPERAVLQQLAEAKQSLVAICNKQDRYLPGESELVLKTLKRQLADYVTSEHVVAAATAPNPIKVRKHQADQSVEERLEQPEPQLKELTDCLTTLIEHQGAQLVLATTWRKNQALQGKIHQVLNQLRRDRALPLIEKFQWMSAAAAFANPVPALDLLATGAINTQLIVELGAIYRQPFAWEQAKAAASSMAQFMVKLGLVELSTQTAGHLLKSNAATFVAGGAVQGISAAYLTRVAGLSLIDYFQAQSLETSSGETGFNAEKLHQVLQGAIARSQQLISLPALAQQAIQRFTKSTSAPGQLAPATADGEATASL